MRGMTAGFNVWRTYEPNYIEQYIYCTVSGEEQLPQCTAVTRSTEIKLWRFDPVGMEFICSQ